MNHEAMIAISVFQAKVTFEFTSLAMNFSRIAWVLKQKQALRDILSERMEKKKILFRVNCQ